MDLNEIANDTFDPGSGANTSGRYQNCQEHLADELHKLDLYLHLYQLSYFSSLTLTELNTIPIGLASKLELKYSLIESVIKTTLKP